MNFPVSRQFGFSGGKGVRMASRRFEPENGLTWYTLDPSQAAQYASVSGSIPLDEASEEWPGTPDGIKGDTLRVRADASWLNGFYGRPDHRNSYPAVLRVTPDSKIQVAVLPDSGPTTDPDGREVHTARLDMRNAIYACLGGITFRNGCVDSVTAFPSEAEHIEIGAESQPMGTVWE